MKKVLYITHTQWGWIKQRPQFLAEELSNYFKVDVWYRMSNGKTQYNKIPPAKNNLQVKGFRYYPFEWVPLVPLNLSYSINTLIWNRLNIDLNEYDYIWVTNPLLWNAICNKKYCGKLIYDCMDDMLSFPSILKNKRLMSFMAYCEKDLIQKAHYVLCSSEYLQHQLFTRYSVQRRYSIINNAITNDIFSYSEDTGVQLPTNSFVYIGTISEWFDFDLLIKALERFPDIHFVLYGPKGNGIGVEHPRIKYMGSIDHSKIRSVMKAAKGLVMPFKINDLILSVNPVKAYEYIVAGKPIAMVNYPETQKFCDYCVLYSNEEEFYDYIEKTLKGAYEIDVNRNLTYVKSNTWSARVKDIIELFQTEGLS